MSPRSTARTMQLKMRSTITAASPRVMSTTRETSSIKSDFVRLADVVAGRADPILLRLSPYEIFVLLPLPDHAELVAFHQHLRRPRPRVVIRRQHKPVRAGRAYRQIVSRRYVRQHAVSGQEISRLA